MRPDSRPTGEGTQSARAALPGAEVPGAGENEEDAITTLQAMEEGEAGGPDDPGTGPIQGPAPIGGVVLMASASGEMQRPGPATVWSTYHPSMSGGPGPNARCDSEEVYSPREAGMAYGERNAAVTGPRSPAGAEATFYAWDHLGTVRLVTDQARTIVERHDYEPYGLEMAPNTNQAGNTHQFTGHERDLNTGYDYMHFRYYGSNMGRFMKPDNIPGNLANPQSWNLYSYVHGNPVNFNDPTGHMSEVFLKEISGHSDFDNGPTPGAMPPPASKEQQQVQNLNAQTGAASEGSTQDPVPPPPPPTPPPTEASPEAIPPMPDTGPVDPTNPSQPLFRNKEVQKQSDKAFMMTGSGTERGGLAEAGFAIQYIDGKISVSDIVTSVHSDGKPNELTITTFPDTIATLHTHGNKATRTPGPGDFSSPVPNFVRSAFFLYVTVPGTKDYKQLDPAPSK